MTAYGAARAGCTPQELVRQLMPLEGKCDHYSLLNLVLPELSFVAPEAPSDPRSSPLSLQPLDGSMRRVCCIMITLLG